MPGLTEVISFEYLYTTGENNENSNNVNESKDSFVRETVEKSICVTITGNALSVTVY